MILNALCSYYDRCKADLAPAGKEIRELHFIIVINRDGDFVRLEDCLVQNTGEGDKKRTKKSYKKFVVPMSVSRTSAVKPNTLWDNCSYALGLCEESFVESPSEADLKKISKCALCHRAFVGEVERVADVNSLPDSLTPLRLFLKKSTSEIVEAMRPDPLWDAFCKMIKTANVSFLVDGEKTIVAEQNFGLGEHDEVRPHEEGSSICLVTGHKTIPQRIIEKATPIVGSQAVAKLVSFQVNSGYDSYGKSQCGNAPISEEAAFKYSTALNTLLGKDSKNKTFIGNRTFLFWGANDSQAANATEDALRALFGECEKVDDPNAQIYKVIDALKSVVSGIQATMSEDVFYFLGLAPNAARIAVVYWQEASVKEFAANILRHFEDMQIVNNAKFPFAGLYSMLSAVTLGGKVKDATPNLSEAIMKSILSGGQYPRQLLLNCIGRIRADADLEGFKRVSATRAAILKAFLNRLNDNQLKIKNMLDKENVNPAYLCGRLFAVLESIQYSANKSTNIAERYLSSASSTPVYVFPNLLNLSVHHSAKGGWGEKAKTEIINLLPPEGFPVHLDTEDQGRFFLGYYHQKADNMKLNQNEAEQAE